MVVVVVVEPAVAKSAELNELSIDTFGATVLNLSIEDYIGHIVERTITAETLHTLVHNIGNN